MINLKFLRENIDLISKTLSNRGKDNSSLKQFTMLEQERLLLIRECENKKSIRNKASKEIGENANKQPNKLIELKKLSGEIKVLEQKLHTTEQKSLEIAQHIPNLLHASVPINQKEGKQPKGKQPKGKQPKGKQFTEEGNEVIKTWGEKINFIAQDFMPKDYLELAMELNLMDFRRAAKISGARFVVMMGLGARLERALASFFLDENIQRGYYEYYPPALVKEENLFATGQLPKFKEDLFKIANHSEDKENASATYLIPTGEVPLTNLYRDEIIPEDQLPLKLTAYTPCFRAEAGSAGTQTAGIIRQHQFGKVEIVKICKGEHSEHEHELLLQDAENLLQKLGLPYRVLNLCSTDIGFAANKTYDLEVWLAAQQRYVEISSCSNFIDFQTMRANIRYKDKSSGKNYMLHTINGSALAIGRTIVALLENNQQKDGSIKIPDCLVSHMAGITAITKEVKN